MPDGEGGGDRAEAAGRAHGVTEHRLDRADRRHPVAEHRPDRPRLAQVVGRRPGAVGAHVVDVHRLDPGVVQRQPHAGGDAVLVRRDHVVGVAVQAVAQHLGVDPGVPGPGVLQRLQHQRRAALAGEDPGAVPVERAALPLGQRAQPEEAGVRPAAHRVRAAGHHHVRLAGVQQVVGVADGVVAGRTGGGERDRLTGQAQLGADRVGQPLGGRLAQGPRRHGRVAAGDEVRDELLPPPSTPRWWCR